MTKPYHVHFEPTAHKERKTLPGHVRQRVKRLIDQFAHEPRPHHSKALDTTGLEIPKHVELRRIRLEKWRIIYAVGDTEKWVWVWGVRKLPPYDYNDIENFTELF